MKAKSRIREFRKDRKISQGQLALQLQVDRSYISKIESGQRMPGRELLYRLARKSGIPVEELMAGERAEG